MRKTVVGIFAHPDDEAFGPGGTIALLAQKYDVYLICATRGESGQNHSTKLDGHIGEIREKELQESAKVLGVKNVYFLDFLDGTISNNLYHKIAKKIQSIIEPLQPEILLTYEYRGVSGHLDHIAVSMITNYLFHHQDSVKKLMMYCLDTANTRQIQDYFIFFPPGYKHNEIDEVVDTSEVWETKVEAMKKHESQIKDIKQILPRLQKLPKREHFLVKRK